MIIAIFYLTQANKNNYSKILKDASTLSPEEKKLAAVLPSDKTVDDLIHWCMIPMVNESYEILHDTVDALKKSNYDLSKLAITVNGEAAKKEHFLSVWKKLEKEFDGVFGYFNYTLHELAPDEMIGK